MPTEIEDFPEEIVRPIKALNDKNRRRIILALTTKNEFSYSEIQDRFDLRKGTLTHHLHYLVSSGLIRNFTKIIPRSRQTSYYELTDFGCKFIDGLHYTLAPRPTRRTNKFNSTAISDDYPLSESVTAPQTTLTKKLPEFIPPPMFLPLRYELSSTTIDNLLNILHEVLKGDTTRPPKLPEPILHIPEKIPPVDRYLREIEDFPEEIVRPIKALNDKNRRRIILALTTKNEFSYSEIQDRFDLRKGTLTHHLHYLVSSGLIRNFTKIIPRSRQTSYYELTDFGYRFIDGLYYTLTPRPVRRPYTTNNITISDDYPLSGSVAAPQTVVTGIVNPKILVEA